MKSIAKAADGGAIRDLFGEPGVVANGIDIAGVDEVGRGPVVAGAVVPDPAHGTRASENPRN